METERKPLPSEVVYRNYDFRWEVLDVLIGGKSLIDTNAGLTGFPMKDADDATRFLASYGFDLDDPIERAEVFGNFHEALAFIRKFFLQPENPDGLKLEIPRKIVELRDFRDLLLMSSLNAPGQKNDPPGQMLRDWACAMLKVIHAIAHVDKDIRAPFFADIQKQIFDRFYKAIHRDPGEKLFLGESLDDPFRVPLVAFETKAKKSRESILLKLLHKPESVAQDIFDRVGLRFIAPTVIDALRVVKYLKDSMIVMPANIKPSRSRNTLIEVAPLKRALPALLERTLAGKIDEGALRAELEAAMRPSAPVEDDNPHSSEHYRAIQFTCRQLIKLRHPLFDDLRQLKALAREHPLPREMADAVERVDLKYLQREVRFFYPFEVQVMDEASARDNEKGRSSHSEYRKSQIQAAMRRVFGPLAESRRVETAS